MSSPWPESLITRDASDQIIELTAPAKRIISLVPSISETIMALGGQEYLIGRTRYCIHPSPEIESIPKFGGTKDIEIQKVIEAKPDLVLANREENLPDQISALREAGLKVHVSEPRTPDDGLRLVAYVASAIDHIEEGAAIVLRGEEQLAALAQDHQARQEADAMRMNPKGQTKALALIWRDPWMAAGGDTYISGMIEALGAQNLIAERQRYPELTLEEIAELAPNLILLPSEPWKFREIDQAELMAALSSTPAAQQGRILLCSGEDLMWFGARTPVALERLRPLFT